MYWDEKSFRIEFPRNNATPSSSKFIISLPPLPPERTKSRDRVNLLVPHANDAAYRKTLFCLGPCPRHRHRYGGWANRSFRPCGGPFRGRVVDGDHYNRRPRRGRGWRARDGSWRLSRGANGSRTLPFRTATRKNGDQTSAGNRARRSPGNSARTGTRS